MHPFNALFKDLRDQWLYGESKDAPARKRIEGRTSGSLAEIIGVRKQVLSCLATGSDNRVPTLRHMVKMCSLLGLELTINETSVRATSMSASRKAVASASLVHGDL